MQEQENQAMQESQGNVTPVPENQSPENSLEVQIRHLQELLVEKDDAFVRAKAEAENIRRRALEDVAKAHKFAIENFAEALVPVKDSLEMALSIVDPSMESLKEGVQMTLRQLTSAFDSNRLIEIIPALGAQLDPKRHQAVALVDAEQEPNTVVSVLRKGYMIADRLLRPAIVTAAQSK